VCIASACKITNDKMMMHYIRATETDVLALYTSQKLFAFRLKLSA
jgi:hypothetical protein